MKIDSVITMRAIFRTLNVLLNVAQLVSASTLTITVNNATLFTGGLTDIMLCLPDQIVQNVSTPSLTACAYLCSTQRHCRGITYSPSTRVCVTCNGTSSTIAEGIQPLSEAVLYYRKEPIVEEHTSQCGDPWSLPSGDCLNHQLQVANLQSGSDWNTATTKCSSRNGYLLHLNTVDEMTLLSAYVSHTDTVGFWTAARWYMDYGWYWAPEATHKVEDGLWIDGLNETNALEREDVSFADQRGCMLPKHGHRLSVCSQHEQLGYICERKL